MMERTLLSLWTVWRHTCFRVCTERLVVNDADGWVCCLSPAVGVMDEELRQAEDKFTESKQLAEIAMQNLLDNDVSLIYYQARFPFKRNRLRCVSCVNENCKERKRLRWQAANHGCHCFDRAFLLAGTCVCCVKISRSKCKRLWLSFMRRKRLRLNGNRALEYILQYWMMMSSYSFCLYVVLL